MAAQDRELQKVIPAVILMTSLNTGSRGKNERI